LDWILLAVLSLTAIGAVAALTVGVMGLESGRSIEALQRRQERDRQALQELYIRDLTPRQLMWLTIGGAVIVFLLLIALSGNWPLAITFGVATFFSPRAVFSYLRHERLRKFEEQLPDALTYLSNSTKAGLSLAQAIEEVSKQAPPPACQEFGLILQEHQLGTDLGTTIENARHRLQSRSFNLVASALIVSRSKGGNLPEALDTMSNSLKEIWRTEQKLITASSEGRKAVWVISGMPILIFLMIALFQPQIARTLVTDLLGMIILFVAVCLYAGGFYWLLRVLRTDV
jgi:tight adherence protein B